MAVAVCPSSDTLAAFAGGDLLPDELAAVAEHVSACAACCAALKLVPEDSLVALARAAAGSQSIAPGASGPAAASTSVPTALAAHPRYRIAGTLGAGGMGVVYKAQDRDMDRVVALKVVTPHLTAKASAVERFRKEVKAAARLEHDNIVRAYDTGEADGSHFLVMEFVEGVSLDRLIAKRGPLAVQTACSFARQAALGLQHAHNKGMVHRDVKPQNLMVTRKGRVKILDFGLARFASTGEADAILEGKLPFGAGKAVSAGATNPNFLLGTPDYLSPEQTRDSHNVDARSDVYSLGCTLYFLLTGRPPFSHVESLTDKLRAHVREEPPGVQSLRAEVPDGLAAVLTRMMAKSPEDRYQSASEAAAALLPFARADAKEPFAFEVIDAAVLPPAAPPALSREAVAPLAIDTASEWGDRTLADRPKKKKPRKRSWWKRRRVPMLAGLAAALVVAAVAVAVSGWKKTETPTDPDAGAKTDPQPTANPPEKGEKGSSKGGQWIPPSEFTPNLQVLYVLPSKGTWLPDYLPVRERLEKGGVKVVTASTDGGESEPDPRHAGSRVKIDLKLADANPDHYDAVAFCGFQADEYVFQGRGKAAAAKLIDAMQRKGKPIAAICVGQAVLLDHEVLKGRKAARCQQLAEKYPSLPGRVGVKWVNSAVEVDGKIVTAAGPEHAEKFAAELIRVMRASQ